MRIKSSIKSRIRKYEYSLLNKDHSYEDRLYTLYLLLVPVLKWHRGVLSDLGLSNVEIESELYLMIDSMFRKFDKEKSSLVPYLEKALDWYFSSLKNNIEKDENLTCLEETKELSLLDEEFYFSVPDILYGNSYIKKCFTKAEKYLIYRILISDDDRLSERKLARDIGISRENLRNRLENIRNILINGGYNEPN